MSDRVHRGGCQCGAVRMLATGDPVRISVCHCRMCQRATGGAHAPLAEFRKDAVAIEGAPATFASSDVSERGFCAACGTALFLRDRDGDAIELMLGAMADPASLPLAYHYGVESRMAWAETGDLPAHETGKGPNEHDGAPPKTLQAPI